MFLYIMADLLTPKLLGNGKSAMGVEGPQGYWC
jgi:hypothetical protein